MCGMEYPAVRAVSSSYQAGENWVGLTYDYHEFTSYVDQKELHTFQLSDNLL